MFDGALNWCVRNQCHTGCINGSSAQSKLQAWVSHSQILMSVVALSTIYCAIKQCRYIITCSVWHGRKHKRVIADLFYFLQLKSSCQNKMCWNTVIVGNSLGRKSWGSSVAHLSQMWKLAYAGFVPAVSLGFHALRDFNGKLMSKISQGLLSVSAIFNGVLLFAWWAWTFDKMDHFTWSLGINRFEILVHLNGHSLLRLQLAHQFGRVSICDHLSVVSLWNLPKHSFIYVQTCKIVLDG